ncbi:Swt1 family HEPN domain-containing protein [Dietzia maris]|uniref:Swt1 family HEPN domain-containing protein n=1 Tax=Dietzia maris TaxID=37915 RepID=A0AAE4QU36_9ACTN|nr:Swt1 family HEPN domain-containing protein [Dietzia maris]MDV6298135.1 Swt1 family HEPN domain-containing protein [Dietzia maris]
MALSNRDRVDRGFIALARGLDTFLGRVLGPELADASWIELMEAVDYKKGLSNPGSYSTADPSVALKFITEKYTAKFRTGWYPLGKVLTRSQESWASELRDTRNIWAHEVARGFSNEDAHRALDTIERLLRACGQPAEADEVATHRIEVLRQSADKSDRAVSKSVGLAEADGANLPAWRTVLQPHPDVATGRFHAAEFAADLNTVASGRADSEYGEPVPFFERTFLTEGLKDLLVRSARRLGGDAGASPVINLQTTFGGGKTHSMLAVWHLASGTPVSAYSQDVQDLLGDYQLPTQVKRVALVGNHLQAGAPNIMPDGTVCNTLWGVLAWQLAGKQGFAAVAEADRTRTNPGDTLRQLLAEHGPSVILIDEWVAYARELYGRDDLAGGTFDTQFTFAQTLTEAVKAVPGTLLLISIPASAEMNDGEFVSNDEEVGGTNGRETLQRLQRVVARVADQWRPADKDESFEIVRRRLFVSPDREALGTISGVAKAMVAYYRKNNTVFPKEVQTPDYERQIRACYPVHPELFDQLYADWSTLPRFQRTRGVLRLMNVIVGALWASESAAPLIMPGNLPLAQESVGAELTQYLDDNWKAIIATDVDGPSAIPGQVDKDSPTYGSRHTARRLARTVFMGATPTLRSANKGLDRARVFLGTALPGDTPGNFHSALEAIADRATYFYSGGQAYWFDTQANTTRAAADYAEGLAREDVWAEIERRLRGHQQTSVTGFSGVHVAPESPADVPDTDAVRLVLVPPQYTHSGKDTGSAACSYVEKVLESRGSGARINRNMLIFLAADSKRADDLEGTVRKYLAWQHIVAAADTALDLTANQKAQAVERVSQHDQTTTTQLMSAYIWLVWPEQFDPSGKATLEEKKADGAGTSLAERAAERARTESQLSINYAPSRVRMDLDGPLGTVWRRDREMSVGTLWSYYSAYPYLQRLRDRSVLEHGLIAVPDDLHGRFALAEAKDGDRYVGLVLPEDDNRPLTLADSALVVDIEIAEAQREADRVVVVPPGGNRWHDGKNDDDSGGNSGAGSTLPPPSPPGPGPDPTRAAPTRYYASFEVPEERPSSRIKDVLNEVVANLRSQNGVTVRVSLEIEAEATDGFDESTVRTVRENGDVLNLDGNEFE